MDPWGPSRITLAPGLSNINKLLEGFHVSARSFSGKGVQIANVIHLSAWHFDGASEDDGARSG